RSLDRDRDSMAVPTVSWGVRTVSTAALPASVRSHPGKLSHGDPILAENASQSICKSRVYSGRTGDGFAGLVLGPVGGVGDCDSGSTGGGTITSSISRFVFAPAGSSCPLPIVPGDDGTPCSGGTILSGMDVSGIEGLGRF